MTFPLVTIITPTYNRADYLAETIESILTQEYPNLEYVVLDDGSTDNSLEIIERYAGRLVSDSHPNMGEARTVNKGFQMAHGEIIGVVNSDDPLLPGAVVNIVGFMLENPNVGVVYPDWEMIDSSGKLIKNIKTFPYRYIDMIRWHHCVPGPGTFFRSNILQSLGGRDPQFRYVSDFDFWLRAGLLTDFARIPITLATFRVHAGSASSSQTNTIMAEEHIRLVDKIYSLPSITAEALLVKKEAYSSAYYIAGCVCQSGEPALRKRYLLRALSIYPTKYLFEYRQRLVEVIIPLTMRRLSTVLKPINTIMSKSSYIYSVMKRSLRRAGS